MRTAVISFTKKGRALSEKIRDVLSADDEIRLYTGQKKAGETEREYLDAHGICFLEKPLAEWAGEQFEQKNVLIFVGACGIAVRAIAGAVRNKLKDSPVLVVDECGQYVIPILSGHVGGANEIAERLASAFCDCGDHNGNGCEWKICGGCICAGSCACNFGPPGDRENLGKSLRGGDGHSLRGTKVSGAA